MGPAPLDGYHSQLRVGTGAYVGRTRDGAHYFKLVTYLSKDMKRGPYAKLMIWLQPEWTMDLEGLPYGG